MKLVDSAEDITRNVPSSLWADELILGWNLELYSQEVGFNLKAELIGHEAFEILRVCFTADLIQ